MLAVILYKYSVCACLTSKCMSDYQNWKKVNLWTFLSIMQSIQMSREIITVIYFYEGEGVGEGVESFEQCVISHCLINKLWF